MFSDHALITYTITKCISILLFTVVLVNLSTVHDKVYKRSLPEISLVTFLKTEVDGKCHDFMLCNLLLRLRLKYCIIGLLIMDYANL